MEEKRISNGLLNFITKTPQQYTSMTRSLAADVLLLRAMLVAKARLRRNEEEHAEWMMFLAKRHPELLEPRGSMAELADGWLPEWAKVEDKEASTSSIEG